MIGFDRGAAVGWRAALVAAGVVVGCLVAGGFPAGAAGAEGKDFVLDSWQTEAGLPHNAVTALLQTRDGYLWVGTSNGLARFDGVRFSVFRTLDHPGLRSNRILCLHEDREGVLWAGTEQGGLVRYENSRFRAVSASDGLASETVLCVGADRAGTLWVGTDAGLSRSLDGRPNSFTAAEGIGDNAVCALHQPVRSTLLVATRKGLYQVRQERVVPFVFPGFEPMRSGVFYCLHEDEERCLWAGGEPGLVRLQSSGTISVLPPAQLRDAKVSTLLAATDGRIWFGTTAGDLYQAARAGPLEARLIAHLPGAVTALCEDHEGNLWAGTAGGGLFRVKRRQLSWVPFAEPLGDKTVGTVFEAADGGLRLLAADNALYACRDGAFKRVRRLPLREGIVVETVCAAGPDNLWLGTRSDGLLKCTGDTLRQFSERDGLSDSQVTVLCADREGGLWLGTRNGGLNYLRNEKVTRFNTPWGFTGAFACALELDPQGALWVGTTGDGLFRLAEGGFTACTPSNGLPSGHVGALYAEVDCLWIGTAGGLCRLKGDRITEFPSPNPLNEEAILRLCGDAEGNLWVGSSSGLYRFRKEQLNDYADGKARFLDVVPYGREDGLPAIQCVPQVQSRGWPRRPGGLWFVTAKGLVVSDQPALRWNTVPPRVVLETVLVENEPVPLTGHIRIPPGKESLQFQFTALSLTAPGKVAFRYLLEGFDRDWSEVTPSRSARYPKVAPGKYRFRVVARNNDGVWNETGADVALLVAPFWWETHWFRFGLLLAAVVALAGLFRLRQVRRRELERLRLRIASDLHDDVGSSLWSITLLSRMLAQETALAPEARQDINEIHRISVQASNSIRDIIWLINPAFDSLQDLVLRMKDAAGTMLRGSEYRFKCERIDLACKLPAEFRQGLFFLFKEAFTNIAKHARATVVEVQLEDRAGQWRFEIRDNGVGFDPATETAGNGLKNMRARAARMRGTIEIRSGPGDGTTLVLAIPRPQRWRKADRQPG